MYKSLMPGLLSINADFPRAVELAARHGFPGLDIGSSMIAAPDMDIEAAGDLLRQSGIRPGYIGLSPGRAPVPEADWRAAMVELPLIAQRAQTLGFRRAMLVILPFHETLPFTEAFAEHVGRLNEMMRILDDHDIALGLEYVSPVSRRAPYPHEFVHDLRGMLSLCDTLDSSNVGILLDSFHWYCARESTSDLKQLTAKQIVAVHVNDAPPVAREEQLVMERALPKATGVIDIAGFMDALQEIGYDGPITCEPMASAISALNAADDDAVVARVSASLDAILPDSGGGTEARHSTLIG